MDQSHATALHAKHARLDEQLTAETRRPAPNSAAIARIKKMKLKIKETIASL